MKFNGLPKTKVWWRSAWVSPCVYSNALNIHIQFNSSGNFHKYNSIIWYIDNIKYTKLDEIFNIDVGKR